MADDKESKIRRQTAGCLSVAAVSNRHAKFAIGEPPPWMEINRVLDAENDKVVK